MCIGGESSSEDLMSYATSVTKALGLVEREDSLAEVG